MSITTESLQQEEGERENRQAVHPEHSGQTLDDAATASSADRMVPVSEAIRYRKRAQTAEQQMAELRTQLDASQQQYREAEQAIQSLERRRRMDELLNEADAIDLEAARLLTEAAVQGMDEPNLAEAIDDLRRHKPYLFRSESDLPGGLALAPRIEGVDDPVAQAAEQAQHSGDRRDLLRYLRLRRRP